MGEVLHQEFERAQALAARVPELAESLWGAVQSRRAALRGSTRHAPPEWCGSVQDLQTLVEGSVVLDDDGEAEFIPVGTDELPAVKLSSGGLLVRVAKDAQGATGRYTSLVTLMATSSSIWAGVLASKTGDGAAAAACRAKGESVAVRVAGRTEGKIALQLLRREGFQVLMETTDVRRLAAGLEEGPRVQTWEEFLRRGPWGDTGAGIQEGGVSGVAVELQGWRDLTGALGVAQPHQQVGAKCGVEVPLALVAAAAGLPAPLACAREVSWAWSGTAGEVVAGFRDLVLLRASEVVEVARGCVGPLKEALPAGAGGWAELEAAVKVGELLRARVLRPLLAPSPFHAVGAGGPPGEGGARRGSPTRRARRSAAAASRASILAGAPAVVVAEQPSPRPSPQQSPAKRQRSITVEELSQLTPTSLLEAAKKLCREQQGAQAAASRVSGGVTGRDTRRGSVAAASDGVPGVAAIPFPPLPVASPGAAAGGGVTPRGRGGAVGAQALESFSPPLGSPGGAGMDLRSASADHGGSLGPFFPAEEGGLDVVVWVARLAEAGFPGAPVHFMHASGAAGVGFQPDPGSSLEAELMVANVAALVDDLRSRGALPARLAGGSSPADWGEAARNARALLSAYLSVFRVRRGDGLGCLGAGVAVEAGPSVEKSKDKPPVDSFEGVEVATRAVDRQLAVPADMLQGMTSAQALRVEHVRESPFKDLVTVAEEQRERQLDGEIQYFVGRYGQGAAAYLMSNGLSVGRVRGFGVPTALAGIRGHLERRAWGWVESVFGKERAADAQYVAEAQRLGLSVMTGVVPGDSVEGAESVIVRLLGGSKPNEMAGIRAEGGAVSEGTLGSLTGDAAHFSVRSAYQLWALGLARCLGRVLLAVRGEESPDGVLGEQRDFDLQSNLLKIPHTLSNEGLRSTCRHFPRKVAFALQEYRGRPGTPLPDLRAFAAEMGGAVLERRLQDAEYARRSGEQVALLQGGFEERLRSLEARAPRRPGVVAPAPVGARLPGARQPGKGQGRSRDSQGAASSAATAARRCGAASPGAAPGPTPEGLGPPPASSSSGGGRRITSKMQAVSELQSAVRARLGLPTNRHQGKAEPCAWAALLGSCSKKGCLSCEGNMKVPSDLLQAVRAKCEDGVLRVTQPKMPG